MKPVFRIALLAAAVAAGVWLWTVIFPGPEKIIRRPLAAAAGAEQFAGFFSPAVDVNLDLPGRARQTLSGRDEILQAVLAARASVSGLKVKFPDVAVTVNPDRQSALADLDVEAQVAGDKDSIVLEMKFTFQKTDGRWLVTHVETVRPFS